MTVKEAKFALYVCPPDDDTNPHVPGLAEAIEIAKRNPQMMAGWERDKHFDRGYSRKLNSITPPPELAATIMRGGATIFFASRLIAESMGENPDDDSTLPEVTPAEPILPRSEYLPKMPKLDPKDTSKTTNRLWMAAMVVLAIVVLAIIYLLFMVLLGLAAKQPNGAG